MISNNFSEPFGSHAYPPLIPSSNKRLPAAWRNPHGEGRGRDGHTLKSLAVQLRVTRSTISLWERGKRLPSLDNLIALAKSMNQPPCHFFSPCRMPRQLRLTQSQQKDFDSCNSSGQTYLSH